MSHKLCRACRAPLPRLGWPAAQSDMLVEFPLRGLGAGAWTCTTRENLLEVSTGMYL
jgi:hypothetical protein